MGKPSQGLDLPGRLAAACFRASVGQSKSSSESCPTRTSCARESGPSSAVDVRPNPSLGLPISPTYSWLPRAVRR
jgi:hypothetical protein